MAIAFVHQYLVPLACQAAAEVAITRSACEYPIAIRARR